MKKKTIVVQENKVEISANGFRVIRNRTNRVGRIGSGGQWEALRKPIFDKLMHAYKSGRKIKRLNQLYTWWKVLGDNINHCNIQNGFTKAPFIYPSIEDFFKEMERRGKL